VTDIFKCFGSVLTADIEEDFFTATRNRKLITLFPPFLVGGLGILISKSMWGIEGWGMKDIDA